MSNLSMENGTVGRKVKQRPRESQENQQDFQVESISTWWGVGDSVPPWPRVRTQIEKTNRRLDQGGGERSGAVGSQRAKGIRDAGRSFSAHGARLGDEQAGGRERTMRNHHWAVCTGGPGAERALEADAGRTRKGRWLGRGISALGAGQHSWEAPRQAA